MSRAREGDILFCHVMHEFFHFWSDREADECIRILQRIQSKPAIPTTSTPIHLLDMNVIDDWSLHCIAFRWRYGLAGHDT